MTRDRVFGIGIALALHAAVLAVVVGLPKVGGFRDFVRVRIVAATPAPPREAEGSMHKPPPANPENRKSQRRAEAVQDAKAVASSFPPTQTEPSPQSLESVAQELNADGPHLVANPNAAEPRVLSGISLGAACPALQLPGTLLGQGFFPRRYIVRLAADGADSGTETLRSIASFAPAGDPLAFVDARVEALVRARCQFSAVTLGGLQGKQSVILEFSEAL